MICHECKKEKGAPLYFKPTFAEQLNKEVLTIGHVGWCCKNCGYKWPVTEDTLQDWVRAYCEAKNMILIENGVFAW